MACSTVIGQCGDDTRAKVDSSSLWEFVHLTNYSARLGQTMKFLVHHSSTNRYPFMKTINSKIQLRGCRQQEDQNIQDRMKEVLAFSDAAREVDVRKGVGENGSAFLTIKSMLNQTT